METSAGGREGESRRAKVPSLMSSPSAQVHKPTTHFIHLSLQSGYGESVSFADTRAHVLESKPAPTANTWQIHPNFKPPSN